MLISNLAEAAPEKVWGNTKSKVYHCQGSRWYGNTKRGKYLSEVSAIKSGYRPARGSYCSKEGRAASEKLAQSVSGNVKVWVNTKSHVYHCPGARWYGNTKRGKFMEEGEALSAGNRPSHGQKCN